MIRVVVVDDHRFVRDSLVEVLEAAGGIAVVDQCADGSEVAAVIAQARPDVLLLDLQMPRMDGLTAARGVRVAHPEVRIVFLTGGLSSPCAHEARAIGAAGYLLKDDDPAELPGHVRTVAAGGTAWHPSVTTLLGEVGDSLTPSPLTAVHYLEACPRRMRPGSSGGRTSCRMPLPRWRSWPRCGTR